MVSRLVGKFFGRWKDPATDQPRSWMPDGERLYAIGDIHGRRDLLQELHNAIEADGRDSALQKTIVYLGDYIDRGLESRQVIDLLLTSPDDGVQRIFLLGNHEAMLLAFLQNARGASAWLSYGGDATLHSYGIAPPTAADGPAGLEMAQRALNERLSPEHLAFYENLQLCHQRGDYFFVHAGVRPGTPLNQQIQEDMIWIRKKFLNARDDFSKIIVHGHSIRTQVEERPNRIGIDTGAYMTGILTALVLEGEERRYLST